MPLVPTHLVERQHLDAFDVAEIRRRSSRPPADLRGKSRPARTTRDFAKPRGNFPTWTVVVRRRRGAMAARIEPGDRGLRRVGWRLGPEPPRYPLCESLVVLHLDPLAPRTPRLPHRRLGALTQLAASTALHVTFVLIAALIATTSAPGIDVRRAEPIADQQDQDVRLVFLVPELPPTAGGGGGGGNQRPEPIRRAQGVGADTITLRVRTTAVATGPSDDSFRTCRRGRSVDPIDRPRCKAAGFRLFRSDRIASRRRVVRPVDRPRIRGRRRHRKRDRHRSGTWPRTGPRIRRRNWRWRLPRRRGSLRTATDQGSQTRSTRAKRSSNKVQGTVLLEAIVTARRMRVADPCRPFAGRQGASIKKPWRPLPNGGSSLGALGPRRSTCSSRSTSASGFADGCATGNAACFGW